MSSSAAIKAAKQAFDNCTKGIEMMTATRAGNQAIVDSHNAKIREYDSAIAAWRSRKQERETAQATWDRNYRAKMDSKAQERNQTGEGCGVHEGWCTNDHGGGWEADHKAVNWANCGRVVCRKTQAQRDNETRAELGARPDNFTEAQPIAPGEPSQNQTSLNLSCCGNVTQIVASQVKDSDIAQENKCKSDLEKQLNKAGEKTPASSKGKAIPANTQTRNMFIAVIIVMFIIFSSSSSSLVLLKN